MLPFIGGGISNEAISDSPVIRDPQSLFAEVARSAYSEIRALQLSGEGQSVLVTSPLPGDGKSTVSLTLAAAATALGHRAVVVDLDLRNRGVLQTIQQELDQPDIVDVLSGRIEIDRLLSRDAATDKYLESKVDAEENRREELEGEESHIVLLSARRPVKDPAALLTGKRLNTLMDDLRERFDLIVVNAPAALAVRDARAMCDYTDHAVVVARWGSTTIDQMKATLEALSSRVSGVIFDQVDYAEHARRCYGDAIQFYVASSAYYSDAAPARITLLQQLRNLMGWRPNWART
jgi:Mrp family chromosome partitioning ATPase